MCQQSFLRQHQRPNASATTYQPSLLSVEPVCEESTRSGGAQRKSEKVAQRKSRRPPKEILCILKLPPPLQRLQRWHPVDLLKDLQVSKERRGKFIYCHLVKLNFVLQYMTWPMIENTIIKNEKHLHLANLLQTHHVGYIRPRRRWLLLEAWWQWQASL